MSIHPLALLGLMLALLAPGQNPQRGPSEEDKEKVRLRIGMTKEQQSQIEALYAQSDQQRREIGLKMRDLFRQLEEDCYEHYDFDRSKATAIRKEIVGLHKRILLLRADNEEKLRRILNRDQFRRLRELMREQREQFRKQWERRRRQFQGFRPPAGETWPACLGLL